jgi:hybrid cluster-associated redox disulfide protein
MSSLKVPNYNVLSLFGNNCCGFFSGKILWVNKIISFLCLLGVNTMTAQVTKDMLVSDIIEQDRNLAGVFFAYGLYCLGCVMARHETLEQACQVHGIDVEALVRDLNQYLEKNAN